VVRLIINYVRLIVESLGTKFLRILIRDNINKKKYSFFITENIYNPHITEKNFETSFAKADSYTIISPYKFRTLFWAIQESPVGNIVDIGVLRGGSSIFLASLMRGESKLFSVDNWSVNASANTYAHLINSSSLDLDIFKDAISNLKIEEKISICDDSLNSFIERSKNILCGTVSIIHFDIYDDEVFNQNIEDMLGLLMHGGCLLIGGYGALSLHKLTRAVNKFTNQSRTYTRFFEDKSGYGIILKI
jgi:hypothetical protein